MTAKFNKIKKLFHKLESQRNKPAGKVLRPFPEPLSEDLGQRDPLLCTPESKHAYTHADKLNTPEQTKGVQTQTFMNMMAYIFDVQRVACDPLHRFEQEAGQRHAFTPVVCGDFLIRQRDDVNNRIKNPVPTLIHVLDY